ncbi:hypothetical protein BZL41_17615 [Pseudomonas sp. PIC25]|nr:hypothetical protein BZL41_17615 [Pseudomonas sp. PIC25]
MVTKAPAPYGLCFAGGTLIHTKEGMKPIEQIQVGDWVLTQPEETGERTYKRVTRTTHFEDSVVWTVSYYLKNEWDQARAEGRTMPPDASRRLVVTPNHPFWIRGKGWVQVKDLWALNQGQGFENESDWAEFEGYEWNLNWPMVRVHCLLMFIRSIGQA